MLADSDEAAVSAARYTFDSAAVILLGGEDPVLLDKGDLYDDVVIALTNVTPEAFATALAICGHHLHADTTIRLSVTHRQDDDLVAALGKAAGYGIVDVEFREGEPFVVLKAGAGDGSDGTRLSGVVATLRAADRAGLGWGRRSTEAQDVPRDLEGQLAVARAAEEQLAARADQLREQLDAARAESREARGDYDKLSRSKLGRLTLQYWGAKRHLRAGRRRGAPAALLRMRLRPILLTVVLLLWLTATTMAARQFDWSLTRWLVVQLILLTSTLVVLQVKGQRLVIREMEDLRRRAARDRKAVTDTARGVSAVRSGLDKLAKQLDAVSGQADVLAEAGEAQLGAVRAARVAVTDLAYQLGRRLPHEIGRR
ncbi:hypothetical protein [Jiangella alkaliphila]|uniref:hypothetical protein n=1 Tax=Jiangella alkaliphila TaxID=419479 RepID=UPI00128E8DED|nr:hypothetical protein [Jiangella alkaliphila]